MNMFLRIAERLDRSDDPVYIQAVDMHVNGILDYLMIDYFNFRELLGEFTFLNRGLARFFQH